MCIYCTVAQLLQTISARLFLPDFWTAVTHFLIMTIWVGRVWYFESCLPPLDDVTLKGRVWYLEELSDIRECKIFIEL